MKQQTLTLEMLPVLRKTVHLEESKTYKSFAKHMITNRVWDSEKNKYVKVKRFKKHIGYSKKEMKTVFNPPFTKCNCPKHSFRSSKQGRGDITYCFDKNEGLCRVISETEDANAILSKYRGVQLDTLLVKILGM